MRLTARAAQGEVPARERAVLVGDAQPQLGQLDRVRGRAPLLLVGVGHVPAMVGRVEVDAVPAVWEANAERQVLVTITARRVVAGERQARALVAPVAAEPVDDPQRLRAGRPRIARDHAQVGREGLERSRVTGIGVVVGPHAPRRSQNALLVVERRDPVRRRITLVAAGCAATGELGVGRERVRPRCAEELVLVACAWLAGEDDRIIAEAMAERADDLEPRPMVGHMVRAGQQRRLARLWKR